MKKNHISIPKPASTFLKVECGECGEAQVIYSHASTSITCNSCGNEISKPTGAVAKFNGKISGNAE